jgi:TRAF3-interacting protein 1
VQLVDGVKLEAKPGKIVAGQEPEKTNAWLQAMCKYLRLARVRRAASSGKDCAPAVKKILAAEAPGTSCAFTSAPPAGKDKPAKEPAKEPPKEVAKEPAKPQPKPAPKQPEEPAKPKPPAADEVKKPSKGGDKEPKKKPAEEPEDKKAKNQPAEAAPRTF